MEDLWPTIKNNWTIHPATFPPVPSSWSKLWKPCKSFLVYAYSLPKMHSQYPELPFSQNFTCSTYRIWNSLICLYRADSRFAPSQWETVLLCNDVSHWLGASLESALLYKIKKKNLLKSTCPTGIFTCPGLPGSGKLWTLIPLLCHLSISTRQACYWPN